MCPKESVVEIDFKKQEECAWSNTYCLKHMTQEQSYSMLHTERHDIDTDTDTQTQKHWHS